MASNPGNTPEYSVSELAGALKRTVEAAYGQVRVRGEISGWKRAASGHCYLCLKDDGAVIDGVMWKATAAALRFRAEDGLEVVVTGKLTTYPGRSKYQIVIERMEPAGVGALLAQVEERKRRLAEEGLFDPARKRPLPYIPRVIGVVTSPTGAVIRDILHRLADRFPRPVLVWPVQVQGDAAAGQIVAALTGFNALTGALRPDLLIVARGGGSIEDLAAFNEEAVVRAVAASAIPVITAVGHETDTTLVDFASDHRAPTPTAAAERAVPVLSELRFALADLGLRQDRCARRGVTVRAERLGALRLPGPRALLGLRQQRFDELGERLPRALKGAATHWRARLDAAARVLRPALLGAWAAAARDGLLGFDRRLDAAWEARRAGGAMQLTRSAARLRPAVLTHRTATAQDRLSGLDRRLDAAWRARQALGTTRLTRTAARLRPLLLTAPRDRAGARLGSAVRLLETLGPRQVMARGYALVLRADRTPVTSAAAARAETGLTLGFLDGEVAVSTATPRQGRLL